MSLELTLETLGAGLVNFWNWLGVSPAADLYGSVTGFLWLVMVYHTVFLFVWKTIGQAKLVRVGIGAVYVVLTIGLFLRQWGWAAGAAEETTSVAEFWDAELTTLELATIWITVLVVVFLVVVLIGSLRQYTIFFNFIVLLAWFIYEGAPWINSPMSWLLLLLVLAAWLAVGLIKVGGN